MGHHISAIPRVVSWMDVKLMVRHAQPGSAIFQEITGEDGQWSQSEHFLASILDGIRSMIWQNGGGQGEKPTPVRRPGEQQQPDNANHFGADPVTVDEFNSWWDMEVTE